MRRPKFLLSLLIMTGLFGLAPVWYQLQKSTLSRQAWIEELATAAKTGIPSVTGTKIPVANSNRLASASRSKQSPQAEARQPADEAIDPEARAAAVRSFQTTAKLSTARLNPEVARQLGVDASDSSIDR